MSRALPYPVVATTQNLSSHLCNALSDFFKFKFTFKFSVEHSGISPPWVGGWPGTSYPGRSGPMWQNDVQKRTDGNTDPTQPTAVRDGVMVFTSRMTWSEFYMSSLKKPIAYVEIIWKGKKQHTENTFNNRSTIVKCKLILRNNKHQGQTIVQFPRETLFWEYFEKRNKAFCSDSQNSIHCRLNFVNLLK